MMLVGLEAQDSLIGHKMASLVLLLALRNLSKLAGESSYGKPCARDNAAVAVVAPVDTSFLDSLSLQSK